MWNPELEPVTMSPSYRIITRNLGGRDYTFTKEGQESRDIDSIDEASNFMKMHRLGQQQYEDKWRFQEPGYAGRMPDETWGWGPMP